MTITNKNHYTHKAHHKAVCLLGLVYLKISRKALSKIPFLGSNDMYLIYRAIDAVEVATKKRVMQVKFL